MSASPATQPKVSISEQSSVLFSSLGLSVKPTEKVVEVEEVITPVIEVMDVKAPSVVEDFLDISDLKVSELKKVLEDRGIKYTATKKVDLVNLVKLIK